MAGASPGSVVEVVVVARWRRIFAVAHTLVALGLVAPVADGDLEHLGNAGAVRVGGRHRDRQIAFGVGWWRGDEAARVGVKRQPGGQGTAARQRCRIAQAVALVRVDEGIRRQLPGGGLLLDHQHVVQGPLHLRRIVHPLHRDRQFALCLRLAVGDGVGKVLGGALAGAQRLELGRRTVQLVGEGAVGMPGEHAKDALLGAAAQQAESVAVGVGVVVQHVAGDRCGGVGEQDGDVWVEGGRQVLARQHLQRKCLGCGCAEMIPGFHQQGQRSSFAVGGAPVQQAQSGIEGQPRRQRLAVGQTNAQPEHVRRIRIAEEVCGQDPIEVHILC